MTSGSPSKSLYDRDEAATPARAVPSTGKSGSPLQRFTGSEVPIGMVNGLVLIRVLLLPRNANYQSRNDVLGILRLGRIKQKLGGKSEPAKGIDMRRVLAEQDLANGALSVRSSASDEFPASQQLFLT